MADLTITATNVLNISAPISAGLAGEAITAGQAVYLKAADGKLWKARSAAAGTTEEGNPVGIALNGGSAGQTIAYAANGGDINIGATTVKTTTYVLSATAGGIAPQADLVSTDKIVRIGHAKNTTGTLTVDIKNTGAVV